VHVSSPITKAYIPYPFLLLDLTSLISSDNRAITTVIVNTFPLPIQDIKSKAELDFSRKKLKAEDAIVIAALIPSNVS
jgi:hypothetical protein